MLVLGQKLHICPAETGSRLSTNGEYLAVTLVPAAYVITAVIGTINSWVYKRLLKIG